jgi:hypothetical protein
MPRSAREKKAARVTFYVSTAAGDDSNDGLSEGRPLRTVQAAIEKVRDGHADWIILRPGEDYPTLVERQAVRKRGKR